MDMAKRSLLLPHYEDGMLIMRSRGPAVKSSRVTSEAWDSTWRGGINSMMLSECLKRNVHIHRNSILVSVTR